MQFHFLSQSVFVVVVVVVVVVCFALFSFSGFVLKESSAKRDFVGWLLNVPATCECISGTDLHRQFYVLPH